MYHLCKALQQRWLSSCRRHSMTTGIGKMLNIFVVDLSQELLRFARPNNKSEFFNIFKAKELLNERSFRHFCNGKSQNWFSSIMFQNATCKFGVINFFGQNLFVTTITENRYKNIVPNDTIIYTLREWGSF